MNIAICDDEPIFVDYFTTMIDEYFSDNGMNCRILKFYDAKELVEYYKNHSDIDVIVLDIEMPNYNGIDAANDIRKFDFYVPIMFLSNNNSHGDSACDLRIYKYIYKTSGKEKIHAAFDAFVKEQERNNIAYDIHEGYETTKVYINDIMYVQINDHYADFHLANKTIISERNKMKTLIEDARFERFILIHRKTLVNFKFIAEIQSEIILKNGEKLNYSIKKWKDVYNKYLYLRRI